MKILTASLIATLVLTLAACTRSNDDLTQHGGTTSDGTLMVVSSQAMSNLDVVGALPGLLFVYVDVELGNRGATPLPLDPSLFSVETPGGLQYSGNSFSNTGAQPCSDGVSLGSGHSVDCFVVFQIPAPAVTSSLSYTLPDRSTLSVPLTTTCTDCSTTMMTTQTGETCGTATSCGNGRSYQSCTTNGASCSARLLASDGSSFACASCTDCQLAAQKVSLWCSAGSTTGSATGDAACAAKATSSDCTNCCIANHPSGNTFYDNAITQCECVNPGDCSTECNASLCAGQTADALCTLCLQNTLVTGGDCDETATCMSNADCALLLDCINACPP